MLGSIKNLLGGKKSQDDASATPKAKTGQGFFLELDETGNAASQAPAPKPEPAKAAVATTEPPKAEKEQDFFLGIDQTGNVASQAPAPKSEPAPKKGKKKKSVKAEVASTQEKKVVPQVAPAAAKNGKVEPQAGLTFAPNYLLPTPRSRRRPGPSMNMFREMARQAKTPIK
ncbi:MAG: hypothetical protein F6K36_00460 [Symploca sp. SIO3C6]|nr:hypothetical protein [Symploca sp. SIO3C6]